MEKQRSISERIDNGPGLFMMVGIVGIMYVVGVLLTATVFFFIARAIILGLLP